MVDEHTKMQRWRALSDPKALREIRILSPNYGKRLLLSAFGLLLVAVAATGSAPDSQVCPRLQAAHQALLASSFTATRDFTLTINGEIKARQTARVTYLDSRLEREILSQELLDKNLVLDEEDTLSALAVPFDCARLAQTSAREYELVSPDDAERVVFALRDGQRALRPMRWTNEETVRFLWKRLEIRAVATYRELEWQ